MNSTQSPMFRAYEFRRFDSVLFDWFTRGLVLIAFGTGVFVLGMEHATSELSVSYMPMEPVARKQLPLGVEESTSRHELSTLLANVGLNAADHPEFARALRARGDGLSMAELVRRRHEILASIPRDMPTDGWVSSRFGLRVADGDSSPSMHKGIDIAGLEHTVIRAPADGIVRYAAPYGGFGNYLSIIHGYGIVTKYAHSNSLLVKAGQFVKRGDPIATMGETGRARGVHLHYEVWVNDKPVDPTAFMPHTRLPRGAALAEVSRQDLFSDP